jgi:hypothetical protein
MSFLLSLKLEKRAKQVLPEGRGQREGVESRGRNGPNSIYTYE